ncbi:multidrug ABC transporter permease/ATP-binding protein [Neisseria dentiae]|uniref:Multidrug ABC transporter permease/ATP-binding protein n=1 Tax=Neisseria dentiae TaxID=194197 RepID=A0A1X3D9F2_9NEIS|nr:multidrug ABC transporter permease/ATP-binding protein [Neisseria dentiae]OSI16352.1 multidrug ABC transporter permease/ATP-binding protein [Neisseria dentiae]QMT45389.1 multidrug ABC transporter permease/ATP-binding protein [Neisseria dentiae]STZ51166.1 ABC transporter ATP-binding protein, amino acid [Neisseria dentiae]
MSIFHIIYRSHRQPFLLMLLFTLLSGALGIGVLAFINSRLLHGGADGAAVWQFALLVLFYFAAATFSQIKLSQIGHRFICTMQAELVKRVMDADGETVQKTGKAAILASLANDIHHLSVAFTRLPDLVQGLLFTAACSLYLIWLSPKLFAVTALMLALMVAGGHLAVRLHYRYFRQKRLSEDALHRHYETVLDGHKELSLNRYRAERFFRREFTPEAERKRSYHVRADAYHLLAINWGNSVMLAAVGAVFYLSAYHQWASLADAATVSMTVLFMRGPLTAAIGAFPVMLQSQVALQALARLQLPEHRSGFHNGTALPENWQTLRLENVCYTHPAQGGQTFALEPLNLTLVRGETVFLIGANGSGKSTLAMVLAGLYPPAGGRIRVDNTEITEANRSAYRQLFAAVFTDFHLFQQLTDGMGQDVSDGLIADWLKHLQLDGKAKIEAGRILNSKLSQGQKKRLALLAAALEGRSLLILDEWAADQDPQFRRTFYEQLLPLLKKSGYTVFAISHDDKYFHHADRILSMKHGVLSEYGAEEAVRVADAHSR